MKRGFLGALALVLVAMPAAPHHPAHKLDEVMGSREKSFQAIAEQTPDFSLQNADGRRVTLSDLKGKVVVINFIYASCPDVCPLHADRIAEVQGLINASSMKRQVQFISITTDPANDVSEILRGYASAHGLDPVNWMFLATTAGQFRKAEGTNQVHGVVVRMSWAYSVLMPIVPIVNTGLSPLMQWIVLRLPPSGGPGGASALLAPSEERPVMEDANQWSARANAPQLHTL